MTSRILVINDSSLSEQELITNLRATPTISPPGEYTLSFDNKYFSVDVNMLFCRSPPLEELSSTVEAVLLVVEEERTTGTGAEVVKGAVRAIEAFQGLLEEVNPEIRLVLLNSDTTEYESDFLEWALDNGFEFVKLKPKDVSSGGGGGDTTERGLLGESEGFERILSALECHMWPYKTMKTSGQIVEGEKAPARTISPSVMIELENLVESTDFESADFEAMFANMARIKEAAGQLPDDERKQFAEKVALTFFRAMGGDENEINGIDDI